MTEIQDGPLPVVAIVGRPNVGKSTLVNRILGRRAAVVQDVPGVTRDRISYEALWNGKRFTVMDTGGWDPKATGIGAAITRQAQFAMETADVIVLVVDSQVGATDTDLAAARVLRRRIRAAARSVSVAPTWLSTTSTITSAVFIANSACRLIEAPRPAALGSQPPVSVTVNRLPFHSAS